MLTCIACYKHILNNNGSLPLHQDGDDIIVASTPRSKQAAIKALLAQLKDMALKASGACKSCKSCSGSSNQNPNFAESIAASDSARFHYSYHRTASSESISGVWDNQNHRSIKELLSSEEGTPTSVSASGRTESVVFTEEDEPKEWVAHVEPGVLITFVSLPQAGNDLKRIRFNRELFDKWQAQRWWAENYDKVMELYNVQQLNPQSVPLPTPPRSEDEDSMIQSTRDGPSGIGYSSSDSLDCSKPLQSHQHFNSAALASTPKLSSRMERLSIDGSLKTSNSSREVDCSGEIANSYTSDMETTEWVEQDVPGVYITIRLNPGGARELRRVRFSRERFEEKHARLWWEQNRGRIQEEYL